MKKIFTVTLFLFFSLFCLAGGTETIHLSGSKTLSLNGLYFAGSDGIVKSLNNPAGFLDYEGSGLQLTVLNRLAQNRFESGHRGLFKSFRNDEILFGGGIFFALSDNIKFAAAYQPDFNYNIEWPFANNFSTDTISSLLVFDFYNRIISDAISISAALKTGIFSFGVSPVLYRVRYETAFPVTNTLWPVSGRAGYQVDNQQEGWAYGFVFGLLADLTSNMRLGFSLKSGYRADVEGSAGSRFFSELSDSPAEAVSKSTIEFPWIVGLGTIYNLSSQWKLNADARYSLWSAFEQNLETVFSEDRWNDIFNHLDPLTEIRGGSPDQNFRNSVDFGLGIEFLSSETFSYRFSYRFSQSHNESAGYSMFYPTVDQHWFNLGFGLQDHNLVLDAVVSYGIGFRKTIEKNSNNSAGEYGYNAIIPAVTLKYILR
jgi:hypothetical protein